jgi:hypothetical protein
MEKKDICRIFESCLSGRKTSVEESSLKELSIADWENIIGLSRDLGVTLLIYQGIRNSQLLPALIPADILTKFKKIYTNTTAQKIRLLYNTLKIIKLLLENNIQAITLKGFSLAEDLYGDIAARPFADIDLLVKKQDIIKAGRLLLSIGYKESTPYWEKIAIGTFHNSPPFLSNKRPIVDLHWNLVDADNPVKVDIDGLWKRSRLTMLGNAEVKALSLDDMLLYACIHISSHHRFRVNFISLCDIARIIELHDADFDWNTVIEC